MLAGPKGASARAAGAGAKKFGLGANCSCVFISIPNRAGRNSRELAKLTSRGGMGKARRPLAA